MVLKKLALAVALCAAVVTGAALPASADQGCYTGCAPSDVVPPGSPPVPGTPGTPGGPPGTEVPGSRTPVAPPSFTSSFPSPSSVGPGGSVPSSGGLPVTGADVAEASGWAVALLGAGAVLRRVGRRRARRAAG